MDNEIDRKIDVTAILLVQNRQQTHEPWLDQTLLDSAYMTAQRYKKVNLMDKKETNWKIRNSKILIWAGNFRMVNIEINA